MGVLCDRKIPSKLKGKFYRIAIRLAMLYDSEYWALKESYASKIRLAMLYDSEYWALKESYASKIRVAEMRTLRWMSGHTRLYKVSNESIREKV